MSGAASTEGLLRELSPRVLGAVLRRYGHFADAEDAVQEALLAASTSWPADGAPNNPLGWLIRVASRRMADQYRADEARRRREDLAASLSLSPPETSSGRDDTLPLMFLCCSPALTPASAIPLTLRAVGGLTTREIAAAFLVPEATMAQRISRAKAKVKAADDAFRPPSKQERTEHLRSVLHVLYLLFNEGYATSGGPDLARTDLSGEAIRLAQAVHGSLSDDAEVAGLLALMLLTDARRAARTGPDGALVPLAEQDRTRWDRDLISEGVALVTDALRRGETGEYLVQAAIAAVHDQAADYTDTRWSEILSLYGALERMTGNPMVTLNRAVAVAMVHGPAAGLALLQPLDENLGDHHRFHSVRAHLLEMAGDAKAAIAEFKGGRRARHQPPGAGVPDHQGRRARLGGPASFAGCAVSDKGGEMTIRPSDPARPHPRPASQRRPGQRAFAPLARNEPKRVRAGPSTPARKRATRPRRGRAQRRS